mgnify:CR=1 FL=1
MNETTTGFPSLVLMLTLSSQPLIAFLIVGLIVGGLAGYIVFTTLAKPQVGGEVKTFYVLATEWKFTLYDASFKPGDKITVNRGNRVVLVFIPSNFIPHELYEELGHEFIENAIKKGLLRSEEDFEKYEEEAKKTLAKNAYGVELLPHGLVTVSHLGSFIRLHLATSH